jgi:hypothetical protein
MQGATPPFPGCRLGLPLCIEGVLAVEATIQPSLRKLQRFDEV